MTSYFAPIREIQFAINELAQIDAIARLPGFEEASPDLVDAVLEEAGKLAAEVLAPINQIGDQQGAKLVDGKVHVADGFTEAYQRFVEGGWMGIGQDPAFGGQGLPYLVHAAVSEIWNAANMAFAINPALTTGAIAAVKEHGSDELKQAYLPQMVSGEWSGTMNLTEPQAGSDLSAVRTRATQNGDHYLVKGQKIFISWGDHEMTENVIHLVLARLPDAPAGVGGISLFLVPKFLVNEDGSLGIRNDVLAVSLEQKLGVHASPTCAMSFGEKGGAVGYLVGRENEGLSHMFTMMNHARLGAGIQGVAIAERAYQQARGYARDRVQGYEPGFEGRVPIILHADVRRMLMLMRTLTEAMRAVCYVTAASLDLAHNSDDAEVTRQHSVRLDLLVPVAKAWSSEIAQEVTTLGLQVHGGMGFIEETGAAQHFRDARIITIYEGTTGIQAGDLVGRKILGDKGAAMQSLLEEMRTFVGELDAEDAEFSLLRQRLAEGVDSLKKCTDWLLENGTSDPDAAGAVAVNLLMLMGTVFGGYQVTRAAVVARQKLVAGQGDDDFFAAKIISAVFYAEHVMPRGKAYLDTVLAGGKSTVALPLDQY